MAKHNTPQPRDFDIKIETPLTKENFWNELREKFPLAVDDFCNFVDAYKKAQGWDRLFNGGIGYPVASENGQEFKETKAPKFHDLPFDFQVAIWIAYVNTWGGCEYEVDLFDWDLREDITEYLGTHVTEWLEN